MQVSVQYPVLEEYIFIPLSTIQIGNLQHYNSNSRSTKKYDTILPDITYDRVYFCDVSSKMLIIHSPVKNVPHIEKYRLDGHVIWASRPPVRFTIT